MESSGQEFLLYEWHQVSSLEWPIVIYAACQERGSPVLPRERARQSRYQSYRAISRATVEAIEIIATYPYQVPGIDPESTLFAGHSSRSTDSRNTDTPSETDFEELAIPMSFSRKPKKTEHRREKASTASGSNEAKPDAIDNFCEYIIIAGQQVLHD